LQVTPLKEKRRAFKALLSMFVVSPGERLFTSHPSSLLS
jgi:hypothetical protein